MRSREPDGPAWLTETSFSRALCCFAYAAFLPFPCSALAPLAWSPFSVGLDPSGRTIAQSYYCPVFLHSKELESCPSQIKTANVSGMGSATALRDPVLPPGGCDHGCTLGVKMALMCFPLLVLPHYSSVILSHVRGCWLPRACGYLSVVTWFTGNMQDALVPFKERVWAYWVSWQCGRRSVCWKQSRTTGLCTATTKSPCISLAE